MKAVLLLASLAALSSAAIYKDKFKFYTDDNFKYMGKFLGGSYHGGNIKYKAEAKFKRPIENLDAHSHGSKTGEKPEWLIYDLFFFQGEERYLSAEASGNCQAYNNLVYIRRPVYVTLDGQVHRRGGYYVEGNLFRSPKNTFYYVVIADCDSENHKKYPLLPKVEFEVELKTESGSHFSLQEKYTVWTFILAFIAVCAALAGNLKNIIKDLRSESFSFWDEWDQSPQLLLFFSISSLLSAVLLKLIHLFIYSINGKGVIALQVLALLGDVTSQTVTGLVLLLLAYGWTIRHVKVEDMELFIPIFIVLLLVNVAAGALTFVNKGSATKYHDYAGAQGWVLAFFRFCQYVGFVIGCFMSKKEGGVQLKSFFGKMLWSGTGYFFSFPVILIVATLCPYTQQQWVTQVWNMLLQTASIGLMLYEFSGKGEYYKASVRSQSILPNKWE